MYTNFTHIYHLQENLKHTINLIMYFLKRIYIKIFNFEF